MSISFQDRFVGFRSDGGRAYLVTSGGSFYSGRGRLYEIDVAAGTSRQVFRRDAYRVRTLSPKGGDVYSLEVPYWGANYQALTRTSLGDGTSTTIATFDGTGGIRVEEGGGVRTVGAEGTAPGRCPWRW